jgi:colanic acid/amylovoran biosynthesis protein
MGLHTVGDLFRVIAWKITRAPSLLRTPLLEELNEADLIIDFSGDLYGDNSKWKNFLEDNLRLILARMLKKPVAMLFGSPGPFTSLWRLVLAKHNLKRLDLLTNREARSTAMLNYVGVSGANIHSTACPSVFFEGEPGENLPRNQDYIRIFETEAPIFGLILCGWNMPVGPFNKWPRDEFEFAQFVELINWLLENTAHDICVMSHQNATSHDGSLQRGNDHRIIDRLLELARSEQTRGRLFTLHGLYDAAQSKAIIGSFDVVMSGRIHGAVQALSQAIPTAIIDYGHEPKAHKLLGFAEIYGIERLVADPGDASNLVATARTLISDREKIALSLQQRVPEVRNLAARNFDLLQKIETRSP